MVYAGTGLHNSFWTWNKKFTTIRREKFYQKPEGQADEQQPFSLNQLIIDFYLLLGGFCLALLVLITEIIKVHSIKKRSLMIWRRSGKISV